MDDCLELRICLCIVHEYLLVRACRYSTHLILASIHCTPVSYRAQFVVGLERYFVAGIFVVDSNYESRERRETGTDNADGDFRITEKNFAVRMHRQKDRLRKRTLAY